MEFYYHETDGDVLILAADGGLNAANAEQFVGDLERLVDTGVRRIIVDCKNLTHVSSVGLRILLRLHKRLAMHGGDVKLADVHSAIVTLLGITRLNALFDIYPDVDQARLAFRPKSREG